MIYLCWLFLAATSITLTIVGAVVMLPLLLFVGPLSPLPRWASWFDNDIEPLGDLSRKPAIIAAYGIKRILLRYNWLALRNPANNFGVAMAVWSTPSDRSILRGNQKTSDQGEQGWKFNRMLNGNDTLAFEFYYVKAWGNKRCLRVRLGWKIGDKPARLVCVINPLMTFTGK